MSRTGQNLIVWGTRRRASRSSRPLSFGVEQRGGLPGVGARVESAPCGDADRLARQAEALAGQNARLIAQNAELRRALADLEASAEIWIRLYERQLQRANALDGREVQRPSGGRTSP